MKMLATRKILTMGMGWSLQQCSINKDEQILVGLTGQG